jgi:chromosome partitioning protein
MVPLQCEFFALEGLSLCCGDTSGFARAQPDPADSWCVLTMYDRRNNLSLQVAWMSAVSRGSGLRDGDSRNVRFYEAPSHGQPVLYFDVKSIGAKASPISPARCCARPGVGFC